MLKYEIEDEHICLAERVLRTQSLKIKILLLSRL